MTLNHNIPFFSRFAIVFCKESNRARFSSISFFSVLNLKKALFQKISESPSILLNPLKSTLLQVSVLESLLDFIGACGCSFDSVDFLIARGK